MSRSLRILAAFAAVGVTTIGFTPTASATIHPIVESFDCANEQAFNHHPLGDVADPPGQTPGYGSHSDTSSLRGFSSANEQAAFGHKLDGNCGP